MPQEPDDPITEFLRKQGASYAIVANGLRGLVENWERVVDQVSKGYPQGLDDYLNDMDGRQLLENALEGGPADVKHPRYVERYLKSNMPRGDQYVDYRAAMVKFLSE